MYSPIVLIIRATRQAHASEGEALVYSSVSALFELSLPFKCLMHRGW